MTRYMFSAQIASVDDDGFPIDIVSVNSRRLPYQIWHVPGYISSTGETELGLVFRDRIPTNKEIPELYALGKVEHIDGDVGIRPNPRLVIWLSTIESDAAVLREHPDWINYELFRYQVTRSDINGGLIPIRLD